jgi:hypothetical protein
MRTILHDEQTETAKITAMSHEIASLKDEVKRLKSAATSAHTAMKAAQHILRKPVVKTMLGKNIIWLEEVSEKDVKKVQKKLLESINTLAIWGCHE